MTTTLTLTEVQAAGLADWRMLIRTLHARFRTGTFGSGLEFVAAIGLEAEAADHHPDLDLRYGRVDIRLSSHDAGGVTDRDLDLARRISELAAERGLTPEPAGLYALELALDTGDRAAIMPFWAAVLGLDASGDELVDPTGVLPTLWFQAADADPAGSPAPRQRFHLDLWLPPELVQDRIAAAVAAGGTLVSDSAAPSFWVLADAQGNHACLCTSHGAA